MHRRPYTTIIGSVPGARSVGRPRPNRVEGLAAVGADVGPALGLDLADVVALLLAHHVEGLGVPVALLAEIRHHLDPRPLRLLPPPLLILLAVRQRIEAHAQLLD